MVFRFIFFIIVNHFISVPLWPVINSFASSRLNIIQPLKSTFFKEVDFIGMLGNGKNLGIVVRKDNVLHVLRANDSFEGFKILSVSLLGVRMLVKGKDVFVQFKKE